MTIDALAFEAVLIAMSKNKDGVKITLVLHPHGDVKDMAELFGHHIGQRYMIGMTQIGDDEQPVEKPAIHPDVRDAGILCSDPGFQGWLYRTNATLSPTEDEAVEYIHRHCEIGSRAELADNPTARSKFRAIRALYLNQTMNLR